ncbi:MAG TPA: hypothetical protein VMS84_16105 [Mycobacterium sp.]|nr:hypothetical protein [Mycobacterium sp.]
MTITTIALHHYQGRNCDGHRLEGCGADGELVNRFLAHLVSREQASMIRRYIIWRNNHAYDERLRQVIDRANVA